jgi:hypothetical protein
MPPLAIVSYAPVRTDVDAGPKKIFSIHLNRLPGIRRHGKLARSYPRAISFVMKPAVPIDVRVTDRVNITK